MSAAKITQMVHNPYTVENHSIQLTCTIMPQLALGYVCFLLCFTTQLGRIFIPYFITSTVATCDLYYKSSCFSLEVYNFIIVHTNYYTPQIHVMHKEILLAAG